MSTSQISPGASAGTLLFVMYAVSPLNTTNVDATKPETTGVKVPVDTSTFISLPVNGVHGSGPPNGSAA